MENSNLEFEHSNVKDNTTKRHGINVSEFRKIPSLKFLFETNYDGSIVRNVKSKKQLKTRWYFGWYVRINHERKYTLDLVKECWPKMNVVKVQVDDMHFSSMHQAARYLAKQHNSNAEHVRDKLRVRRRCIYGHKIVYSNAETRRTHSTE